eukprot:CAMPEP_0201660218 /NCGR_PEP_ID=MMETSP0494-20130426/2896_1 /ASSEMBLY_ACC=CAM_ASM_000839 /TAXON_ID=420259 /ORGANISM="Thalassiosira gravida, Strain GMp14c1" /LENGTH=203 /DNA_ID=CAMNT_0048137997 /DNA_START=224 /DNA_END=835 /DNA_ORIENTATION=+
MTSTNPTSPTSTTTTTTTSSSTSTSTSSSTSTSTSTTPPEDLEWEEWDSTTSPLSFGHHCLAGSFAGVAEHTLLYPLDTVKTCWQSQVLSRGSSGGACGESCGIVSELSGGGNSVRGISGSGSVVGSSSSSTSSSTLDGAVMAEVRSFDILSLFESIVNIYVGRAVFYFAFYMYIRETTRMALLKIAIIGRARESGRLKHFQN